MRKESKQTNILYIIIYLFSILPYSVTGQSLTCLTADTCLTANPGVASSYPAWFHTFVKIDHEIISTAILLPSADSRRVVVSYKQKYVHKELVNHLVKSQACPGKKYG